MDETTGLDFLNSIGLLKFDSFCYREITLSIMEHSKLANTCAFIGDEVGYSAFMYSMVTYDLCLVAHEGLRFLSSKKLREEFLRDTPNGFADTLRTVRNNHHLYDKFAPYSKKVNAIIAARKSEFKTIQTVSHSKHPHDLALVYLVDDEGKTLIGSDIVYNHLFFPKNLKGDQLKEFSTGYSSLIESFNNFDFISAGSLEPITKTKNPPQIELFDSNIDEFFGKTGMQVEIAFRLLVILSRLSYVDIVLNTIAFYCVNTSIEWTVFFAKFVSITYDEVFDSIANLCRNIDDRSLAGRICSAFSENDNHQSNIEIARKLRNMIHYSDNQIRITGSDTIDINIVKLHSVRTGINTPSGYKRTLSNLLSEISIWLATLRSIFNHSD